MRIPVTPTLALSAAALACTVKGDDTDTTSPDTEAGATMAPPTTGETSGELAPLWCNGLEPDEPLALTVANRDGDELAADGSELQLDCGGQGLLMFPIFPHFGGFVPDDEETASFDVTLDVEGYDVGPNGHFFEFTNLPHEVNCARPPYDTYEYYTASSPFIPIFPPDAIPDVSKVDGRPGVLHVTLHAPGMDVQFDANVIMHAVPADFGGVCGYG